MIKRALFAVLLVACGGSKPVSKAPDLGPPPTPVAVPQPAKPVDPASQPLPLFADIKHGTLASGLQYFVLPNKKPENRVLLWLAVNSGSVQEDDDQQGLAHLVEHMAFNGTKRFEKHKIIDYIEKSGLRFGADLNAYTSWEETVYTLEVPSDQPDYIDTGLDILRDWSADITFDPKEVELERPVVMEEWRLSRGAGRRLFDKHVKQLYKGTRYANRITIGLPEIIQGAPREAIVRYYKDWYRPDQMAVIVVGTFPDAAAIEKQITQKFGDLKKPATPRPRPHGGVPKAEGTRVSIETDKEATGQTVSIANMRPHRPEATEADLRRSLAEQLYVQIFNERLRVIGRKPDAPFLGAGGSIANRVRDVDAFTRDATVKGGRVEDALQALFAEVLRIEQHGITQPELDRARVIVMRGFEQNVADAPTQRSNRRADEIVRHFLEDELIIGPVAERDLAAKLLPAITVAELNQLANGYGGAENRAIVISGPVDKPLPTRERVLAIVDGVAKQKLEPWVDKPPPATLMAQLPKPGKIVKETKIDKIGVTEWTLSNGVRVLVKPTDFEADNVILRGSSPGGLAMASDAQYPNARFADDIAALGGVAELDTEDLGKVLAGKRAGASTSINSATESVSGSASAKDLEAMFQLVHLKMTAPRKDEGQIAVWRANTIQSLTDREKSPDYQYQLQSDEVLWKGHPRRKSVRPADVAKVDADKALAFYKDRFGDAADFTFVIVGTADVATLRPLVETYLASLPAKGRKEKEKDIGARRVGGLVAKTWNLGQEPKARVSIQFHAADAWTRDKDRDLYLLNRVMGIRLREVMREDMGGVYGVSAGGFIARSPYQEHVFSVGFGAKPERVDELIAAARAEIAAIQKAGVADDYLDRVRKGYEREHEQQLKSNAFWAGWLGEAARFGDDPTLVLETAPMLKRITNDNLKAAAKRYIDAKVYYQSIMLPADFKGTKEPKPAPKQPPAKQPPPPKDPKVVPGAEKAS